MKRRDRNPHCPVNVTLEVVGDPWTLLVIRDIVFYGKSSFGQFLASEERITSSVLADRLAMLTQANILAKTRSATDRRGEVYSLTEKGLALIPLLIELANWGVRYGPDVAANASWIDLARTDPQRLRDLVHDAVEAGQAVWSGPDNLGAQLHRHANRS